MAARYLDLFAIDPQFPEESRYPMHDIIADSCRDVFLETDEMFQVVELTELETRFKLQYLEIKRSYDLNNKLALLREVREDLESFLKQAIAIRFLDLVDQLDNLYMTRLLVGDVTSKAKSKYFDYFINVHFVNQVTKETHFFYSYVENNSLY